MPDPFPTGPRSPSSSSQDSGDRSRAPGGQAPGRWGSSDAVHESGSQAAAVSGQQSALRLWAKVIFPFLHSSSAAHPTVPLTNHFLCFCWDFSSSLVCCSTKFGFSWAVLVSKANVQFWNCLASETDKLKITKEKSNFQEVFKTQNKLGSRCSLTYKRSPISVFVYVLNFIFTL